MFFIVLGWLYNFELEVRGNRRLFLTIRNVIRIFGIL